VLKQEKAVRASDRAATLIGHASSAELYFISLPFNDILSTAEVMQ
jgi:hypothetical protein